MCSSDLSKYECIQTLADLQRWIARAQARGMVAVDTETDSLNQVRARMVGISLSVGPGTGCYIPLRDGSAEAVDLLDTSTAPPQISVKDAIAALKPLLEDPGVLKIGHNIKYDMHVFAHEGVAVAPVDDTMVISYVLDGAKTGHGMDELALRHLDHTNIKFSEVCGSGKSQITFDKVPLDKATAYAAEEDRKSTV